MKYSDVKNPVWLDDGRIQCTVTFAGFGECIFIADPNDCTEHGREIHQRLVDGDFGPISEENLNGVV